MYFFEPLTNVGDASRVAEAPVVAMFAVGAAVNAARAPSAIPVARTVSTIASPVLYEALSNDQEIVGAVAGRTVTVAVFVIVPDVKVTTVVPTFTAVTVTTALPGAATTVATRGSDETAVTTGAAVAMLFASRPDAVSVRVSVGAMFTLDDATVMLASEPTKL